MQICSFSCLGPNLFINDSQMVVEEMNILTTVFLRYDNTKITYPNSILATLPILNFYRSPDTGDAIEFSIHISTPPDKIVMMRQRIVRYGEISFATSYFGLWWVNFFHL